MGRLRGAGRLVKVQTSCRKARLNDHAGKHREASVRVCVCVCMCVEVGSGGGM